MIQPMQQRGRRRDLLVSGVTLVVLVGCTTSSRSEPPSPPPPSASFTLTAAPTECPTGPQRASAVAINHTVAAMDGHLPTWLPQTSFGLVSAWSTPGRWASAWATWTDQRCRTVTVYYYPKQSGGPTSWRTQYDKQRACGNSVMGMGECIGYHVALPPRNGALSVQTIGLSRAEADHVVQSIPV
jgi:hypothetical protein